MSEHTQHQDVLTDLNPKHRALRKMIPDVYRGFAELSSAALTPGALDRKTKELIALAIGVVAECDGCIASHAQGAAQAGATKEEAAEAIGVTFLMHGGPGRLGDGIQAPPIGYAYQDHICSDHPLMFCADVRTYRDRGTRA
jgi:AhpD family alkylhydroperoxidase